MKVVKKIFIGLFLVVFMAVEWVADMIQKIITVIHSSIRDLAEAFETMYKDEPDKRKNK